MCAHENQPNSQTKGLFWAHRRTDGLAVSRTPMHMTVLGVLETVVFVRYVHAQLHTSARVSLHTRVQPSRSQFAEIILVEYKQVGLTVNPIILKDCCRRTRSSSAPSANRLPVPLFLTTNSPVSERYHRARQHVRWSTLSAPATLTRALLPRLDFTLLALFSIEHVFAL